MSRRRKLQSSSAQQATPVPSNGTNIAYQVGGSPDSHSISLRQSSSILLERAQFGNRFGFNLDGLTFNGQRDLYYSLGYQRNLDIKWYFERYRRGGIAKRIIEVYPKAVWTSGFDVVEDPDADIVTPFEDQFAGLYKRLNLASVCMRADILANLGRYSAILILVSVPGDMSTELPRLSGPEDIRYLRPLAEDCCKVLTLNTDTTSERFGQPETYQVTIGSSTSMISGSSGRAHGTITKPCHWSRIIHIAKGALEDEIYGSPFMEAVWNLLDDLYKVSGGGAEAAWIRMHPPTIYNLDPEVSFADEQAKQASLARMKDQVENISHGMERSATLSGVDVTWLNSKAETFGPNCMAILQLIAGTINVPMRRLIGSESGELASSQDENNFDDGTEEDRTLNASPTVCRLIDRLIMYGGLLEVPQYEVVWPGGEELSEDQKAQSAYTMAKTNQAQGKDILTPNEIRAKVWNMEPLDELEPDYVDPNAPMIEPPVVTDDPNADPSDLPAVVVGASRGLPTASSTSRIVILGGPRHGKSTLAKEYRDNGKIPTLCGDPGSLVKEPESGVTYLPDNLSWSECSSYIASKWLSSPGPWVCEGVSMARALRKLITMVEAGESEVNLDDIQVIVLSAPKIQLSEGQAAMAKGVQTIWEGIKGRFANVVNVGNLSSNSARSRVLAGGSNLQTQTPKAVNPLKSKTGLRVAHRPKILSKPKQFLFERLNS